MMSNFDIFKDKSSIVLVSPFDIKYEEAINNTLKNVIVYNPNESIDNFIKSINSSKIEKIYLFGFHDDFKLFIPQIKKSIRKCWIFNNSFSSLSNFDIRFILNCIFDYYDKEFIDVIGFTHEDCKIVLENSEYKCEYINLKIEKKKKEIKFYNSIGLLSNDYDPNNNIYNQLASLTLLKYDFCKLRCYMDVTFNFCHYFKIKYKFFDNLDDVMKKNFVNLYINYTNTDKSLIMKSFNYGVPVIVGNTDFYDNNSYLKEHLVVKSDDINEIVEKIIFVKKNYKKIMEEYMQNF